MDINEFLSGGNKVPNPAYNPKTKKGRLQSPYLINRTMGDDAMSEISEQFEIGQQDASFDVNSSRNRELLNKGIPVGKDNTEDDINRLKSNSQSWIEQVGKGLAQIAVNEVGIGTLKVVSDIVDAGINMFNKGQNDYTNPVSLALEREQDRLREKWEIYRKNPNKAFDLSDFGAIMNGLVSVGSSVALLLPALGGIKLIGGINSILKATSVGRKVSNVIRGVAPSASRLRAIEGIKDIAKTGTQAFISRTAENYMEARQSYKDIYDSTINKLASLPDTERALFIEANPEYANMNNEDIAKDIASKKANEVFRNDYAMLLMDAIEYNAIGKIIKGGNIGGYGPRLRVAQEAQRLAISDAAKAEAYAARNGIIKWLEQGVKHPQDIARYIKSSIPFNEAIEEGFQSIMQKSAQNEADMMLDRTVNPKFIETYLTDPEVLESAFYGVLCGALFQGGIKAGYKIKDKINTALETKKMTPEGKAEYLANRKTTKQEIESWNTKFNDLIKNLKDIDNGIAPITSDNPYITDAKGEKVLGYDNMPIRRSLTEEEQIEERKNAVNDFLSDLAIKATDKGYYDLFKEFISNPDITKYMKEQGVNDATTSMLNDGNLLQRLEDVHAIYTNAVDLFYNNLKEDLDEHSAYSLMAAARRYTRNKLKILGAQDKLNTINDKLSQREDYNELPQSYIDAFRIKQTQAEIDNLYKQQAEYRKLLDNRQISKSAYDEFIKETNNRIKYYEDNISKYSDRYEAAKKIKELVDSNTAYTDIQPLINDLLKETKLEDAVITFTTKELLKDKVFNEAYIDYMQYNLPTGEKELTDYYNIHTAGIDTYIGYRAKNAIDIVKQYIKNRNQLDNVYEELLSENFEGITKEEEVKLKEALDILKIGHPTTAKYNQSIIEFLTEEYAKRMKEKKDNDKTIINDKEVKVDNTDKAESPVEETIGQTGVIVEEEKQVKPTPEQEDYIEHIENPDTYNLTETEEKVLDDEAESYREMVYPENEELPPPDLDDDIVLTSAQQSVINIIRDAESKVLITAPKSIKQSILKIRKFDTTDNNYNTVLNWFKENADLGVFTGNEEDWVRVLNNAIRNYGSLLAFKYKPGLAVEAQDKIIKEFVATYRKAFNDGTIPYYDFMYSDYIANITEDNVPNKEEKDGLDDIYFSRAVNRITPEEYAEFVGVITNFIKENNIKDNKINITDFYKYIFKNKDIDYDKATRMFYILQDVANGGLDIYSENDLIGDEAKPTKLTFRDKIFFRQFNANPKRFFEYLANAKSVEEKIAESYHTSIGKYSAKDELRKRALAYLRNNPNKLVIKNNPDSATLSIGVFREENNLDSFIELAYVSKVFVNKDTGTYSSFSNVGLQFTIKEVGNGQYESNLDDLFNNLIAAGMIINGEEIEGIDEKYIRYFKALSKIIKTVDAEGKKVYRKDDTFTDEDNNALIELRKELIDNKQFGYGNKENETSEAGLIGLAKSINDILFFQQDGGFNGIVASNAYIQWLGRVYNNYVQTNELQNAINNASKQGIGYINATAKNIGYETPNYTTESHTIEEGEFIKDDANGNRINYIVSFTDDLGSYVSETGEQGGFESIQKAGFRKNDTGMVIHNMNGVPFIAKFTDSNTILNTEIGKEVHRELLRLFKGYVTHNITYNTLVTSLENLLGTKAGTSLLAYGISINKFNNGTTFLYHNGKPIIKIYSSYNKIDDKGNIIERKDNINRIMFSGIKPIKVGNRTRYEVGDTIRYSREMFSSLDQYLISAATTICTVLNFNRNFNALKNNTVLTKENNPYFYRTEKGSYIIMNKEYDTYFDYVIKNGAFKINVVKGSDGRFTSNIESMGDTIYIDVKSKTTPIVKSKELYNVFEKGTTQTGINVDEIFNAAGINTDGLIGTLKTAGLFNNEIFVDKRNSLADAKFKDGKVYFTPKGINSSAKNNANLLRILVHENLHARLSEVDEDVKNKALADAYETYKLAYDYVMNYNGDDVDIKNAATFLKIKKNKEIFEQSKFKEEEWLVESFTRPELFKALNKIEYTGAEIKEIEKPTLFQRILQIILRLFGMSDATIKKGSLLNKQYAAMNFDSKGLKEFEIVDTGTSVDVIEQSNSPVEEEDEIDVSEITDADIITTDNGTSISENEIGNTDNPFADFDETDFDVLSSESVDIETDRYAEDKTEEYIENNFENILDEYANGLGVVNGMFITFQSETSFINIFPNELKAEIRKILNDSGLKIICR